MCAMYAICGLQNHFYFWVINQFLIERIELCARGGADGAGDAQVIAGAAHAPFDAGSVEIRGVAQDDFDDAGAEVRFIVTKNLDGKVAWVGNNRFFSHVFSHGVLKLLGNTFMKRGYHSKPCVFYPINVPANWRQGHCPMPAQDIVPVCCRLDEW